MNYKDHYFFIIKDYIQTLKDFNTINIKKNLIYDDNLKPVSKVIFMILADMSNLNTTVSYTEIVKNSNYARDTIKRALDELLQNNYIISSTDNEDLKRTIISQYKELIS